jgi:hypothetical protein
LINDRTSETEDLNKKRSRSITGEKTGDK